MDRIGYPAATLFKALLCAWLLLAPTAARAQSSTMSTGAMVVLGGITISLAAITARTIACQSQTRPPAGCMNDLRIGLSQHRIIGPAIVLAVINNMVGQGSATLDTGRHVARSVGLNPDRVRIPSRSHMQPPGNCTPQEHEALEREKDRACPPGLSCRNVRDMVTASVNALQIRACIRARQHVMDRCFMGGNDGHRQQVRNYENALRRCESVAGLR